MSWKVIIRLVSGESIIVYVLRWWVCISCGFVKVIAINLNACKSIFWWICYFTNSCKTFACVVCLSSLAFNFANSYLVKSRFFYTLIRFWLWMVLDFFVSMSIAICDRTALLASFICIKPGKKLIIYINWLVFMLCTVLILAAYLKRSVL